MARLGFGVRLLGGLEGCYWLGMSGWWWLESRWDGVGGEGGGLERVLDVVLLVCFGEMGFCDFLGVWCGVNSCS